MRLSTDAIDDVHAVSFVTQGALADAHIAVLRQARSLARKAAQDASEIDAAEPDLVVLSLDERRAQTAGGALASAWRTLHDDPDIDDAAEALGPSIDRTAATEVWHALNDETRRLADSAAADGLDLILVWWALADACEACNERHGETATVAEGFTDWPPLHPRCRCVVLTEPA